MAYLKFTVKEAGLDFPICEMSEPESAAIKECVSDLVPREFQFQESFWLETDVCVFEEEFSTEDPIPFGLLRCYTHNPAPTNGSVGATRIPHPLPQGVLTELAGKTFQVTPRQLGLSPWGPKVEVTFESPPAAPTVESPPAKKGIKASALIQAALNQ